MIHLLGVVGGGWYFFSRGYMGNKAMAPIEETDSIAENDSIFEGEYDIHSVDGIKQRLSEILTEALKLPEEDAINTFFSKEFRDLYAKKGFDLWDIFEDIDAMIVFNKTVPHDLAYQKSLQKKVAKDIDVLLTFGNEINLE